MTLTSQKIRIKEINCQIVQMSTLVEKQLYASMLALKNHDLEIIDKIMKEDDKVDELQKKIEEECIKFIASEQPLAKDLRNVFTATKVVTDFEGPMSPPTRFRMSWKWASPTLSCFRAAAPAPTITCC